MVLKAVFDNEEPYNLPKRAKLLNGSLENTIKRLGRIYTGVNLLSRLKNNEGQSNMTDDEYQEFIETIENFRRSFISKELKD